MALKRCFKCLRDLPIEQFYRHAQMADGHLSKCAECTKRDVKLARLKNPDRVRAYDRERAKLPHRKANAARVGKEWNARVKDGMKAHNAASRAVLNGDLLPPIACEGCNREGVRLEKHHHDYSRPLHVVWLCKPCHAIADKIRRRLETA